MANSPRSVTSSQIFTPRRVAGSILTCLILVAGATLFGIVGSIIGLMVSSVEVGAIARTILIIGVISLIMINGYRLALGGPQSLWLVSGIAAYILLPSAWSGRALIATGFGLTGVSAWLVDALIWITVIVLVVRSRNEVHDDSNEIS